MRELASDNKTKHMAGQVFGEWTVIEDLGKGRSLCRCSCGTVREVNNSSLRQGKSTSCGHNKNKDSELLGKTFGEWSVEEYVGNGLYRCKCSCGTIKDIKKAHLLSGASKSCGHTTTKFKDLTGKVFGDWYVIEYTKNRKYLCRCSCGEVREVNAYSLTSGKSTNCGCKNIVDLVGRQFGYWTVIERREHSSWLCRCICGQERVLTDSNLMRDATKSCGCKQSEIRAETMINRYGESSIVRVNNPRPIEAIEASINKDNMVKFVNNITLEIGGKPTLQEPIIPIKKHAPMGQPCRRHCFFGNNHFSL